MHSGISFGTETSLAHFYEFWIGVKIFIFLIMNFIGSEKVQAGKLDEL